MGLTLAFDKGNLTVHFASRTYTIRRIVIANYIAKVKSGFAQLASAFRAPVFAPALV